MIRPSSTLYTSGNVRRRVRSQEGHNLSDLPSFAISSHRADCPYVGSEFLLKTALRRCIHGVWDRAIYGDASLCHLPRGSKDRHRNRNPDRGRLPRISSSLEKGRPSHPRRHHKMDEVNAMLEAPLKHYGGLHVLVNNAVAPSVKVPFAQSKEED